MKASEIFPGKGPLLVFPAYLYKKQTTTKMGTKRYSSTRESGSSYWSFKKEQKKFFIWRNHMPSLKKAMWKKTHEQQEWRKKVDDWETETHCAAVL